MSQTVENLFQQYQSANLATRPLISYLLRARVASGLENNEHGTDLITQYLLLKYPEQPQLDPSGKTWSEASQNFNQLVRLDPDTAFKLALKLSQLPPNTKFEPLYAWTRSDGPLNLTHPDLHSRLENYLKSDPSAPDFLSLIQSYMEYPISDLTTKQAFSDPSCFLNFASTYFASQLADIPNSSVQKTYKLAQDHLRDPKINQIFQYYRRLEDVAPLLDRLSEDKERNLLVQIANKTLSSPKDTPDRQQKVSQLIDLIHNNETFSTAWNFLTQSVNLLNQHFTGNEIQNENPVPLNYANTMKDDLAAQKITQIPTPYQLISQAQDNNRTWRLLADLIHVFRKTSSFSFLENYETQTAFYGEAVAIYGKLLAEIFPGIKDGASTLEEIFAVMELNGDSNPFFQASRDWIVEEEEGAPNVDGPGFSHGLVQKIQNHLSQL